MEVCYLLDLLSNFDFNFTLALLISIYNSGMIICYVWHNICGIDNANVFQHEIYSFIAGIDSGLPHTYARTHTHTQAHSSRALSLSQHFRPGNCTLRRIRPDCEAVSLPVPINSSGCGCCYSALFCAPLLNVLFAGAYSPHFKATRRPLERALEPFALTAQHSSRSLFLSLSLALSAHSVAAFYLPPEPCVSYEPRKATDSTLPPTAAAAGSGASCVFGGAVGSTAHEADTTHASNILLSVVGHSRRGDSHQRGRRGREAQTAVLCVYTGRSVRIEIGTRRGVGYRRRRNGSSGGSLLAPWVSASFNVSIIWEAFYVAILR